VIDQSALRWALTAVFAVSAALFLARGFERREVRGLHALASVAMIAMLWPFGMTISPVLYVLVFTACALYLAFLALYGPGLPHPVYHCVMMGAMAAMGLLMVPNAALPTAGAQAAAQSASGAHHGHIAHGAAVHLQTPSWYTAVCVVLAAGFAAATLWWFYLLVRGPQRPFGDVLMALGMSACFASMAF